MPNKQTFSLLGLIALLTVFSACSGVQLPNDREAVYSLAVKSSLDNDPELAASASDHYLEGATEDDPRYDRAARLLANNLERLGLTYAATLYYLDIARAGRDAELVTEAVAELEDILIAFPHDDEVLVQGFVGSAEIPGLTGDHKAFVDYFQGRNSIRAGLDKWGDKRFADIPSYSPYKARANYIQVMRLVATGKLKEADEQLKEILEDKITPEDLKTDIRRTLARIAFEDKRFEEAVEYYEKIRETAPDDPQLLLEMAWSHYYMGQSRRALGLLLALDAPAYGSFIAPERFLLEALALQRLCQFEPARSAAVRLSAKHGKAIDDLYAGVPLQESTELRAGARVRAGKQSVAAFRAQVETESALLEDMKDDLAPELYGRLKKLYERGRDEAARREDEKIEGEMVGLSRELLAAEEGVRLILHEIGVTLLRGRKRPDGVVELQQLDANVESPVLYRFGGEFWTDELDDLVVTIEDRCID